jgi:tetratricopeptide (TPR) repeat protein
VYRLYREGVDAFERTQFNEALRYWEEASAMDSTFLHALIKRADLLVWFIRPGEIGHEAEHDSLLRVLAGSRERMSEYERLYVQTVRDWGNPEAVLRSARPLAALAPRWSWVAGIYAHMAYRPREELEYYARVDTANARFHAMGWYWQLTLHAHHALQDYEVQLELARAAPRDYGSREMDMDGLEFQSRLRAHEIAALAALGRVEGVNVLLDSVAALPVSAERTVRLLNEAVAELRAHGNRDASLVAAQRMLEWLEARSPGEVRQMDEEVTGPWYKDWLAMSLYRLERYEETRAVLEELLKIRPESASDLGQLGYIEALLGNHERARTIAEQLAQRGVMLWRAPIAAALGEREEAMRLLHEQFQEAYHRGDFMEGMHVGQSLESLRGYPPFELFMRPRG